jgi:predicted esterase
MDKSQYIGYLQMEQRSLGAAKVYASKFVNIDIKEMVLVGVSKGGWLVANLSDINPKPWAGMVILNAGRNGVTNIKKDIKGKPVFVGAGESDQNLNAARKAAAYYEQAGADITFETFYGKGHAVDPNAVELRAYFDKIISSNPKKM